ncbi:MAG: BrnT family toxin [Acidobacteriota bacterium]
MRFEWDDGKCSVNVRKHGIDFADVQQVFSSPMLVDLDDREDYGEDRWVGIGWLRDTLTVVVWTKPREDSIRIISARKANRHECRLYEENLRY